MHFSLHLSSLHSLGLSSILCLTPAAGSTPSGSSKQPAPAQQQHLADVLLLHVVDPADDQGGGSLQGAFSAADPAGPSMSDIRELEERVQAAFAASRLRLPGEEAVEASSPK